MEGATGKNLGPYEVNAEPPDVGLLPCPSLNRSRAFSIRHPFLGRAWGETIVGVASLTKLGAGSAQAARS